MTVEPCAQLSRFTGADPTITSTRLTFPTDFYRCEMEFGPLVIASTTLFASIALSIVNVRGSALIYSELSSAHNVFDCDEPASNILIGQRTPVVVFASSIETCLFPNTYDQGDRRHGQSEEIFRDVLRQVIEGRVN